MIKRVWICLLILIVFSSCPVWAAEEEVNTVIVNQINALGLEEADKQTKDILNENKEFEEYSFGTMVKDVIRGNLNISFSVMLKKVLKLLFGEINNQLGLIQRLLTIAVLSAVLKNLNASFKGKSVGELSFYVCYMVLIMIIISSFSAQMEMVSHAIENMVISMQAMIPVFMTILATSGNYGEAAVIGPSVMGAAGILSSIIKGIILPVVTVVTTLEMVNYLSEKGILSQFSALLKTMIGWSMKGMAIVFMAVLSIQKIGTPALNTALGKTAKAAVGAIPVVGDVMSGAVETAAALTGLLKSGASVAAILFIMMICLLPLLKLLAMIFIYKLTAAVTEPICEERLVKCISAAGDFSLLLLGALFTVEIMFLFSVIILLGIV